jgi:hypothetical protein
MERMIAGLMVQSLGALDPHPSQEGLNRFKTLSKKIRFAMNRFKLGLKKKRH